MQSCYYLRIYREKGFRSGMKRRTKMAINRRAFIGCAGAGVLAKNLAAADGAPKRDAVVYVAGHPDDLAGSIGTVMRLAKTYDVHVVDFTHGERGMGPARFKDGSCAKLRTAEEELICRKIGVKLHWCSEIDGEAFACREACEHLADLYRKIKPRAIIMHWLVETHNDHIMSSAAAIKAAQMANIKPEMYFQEQDVQSRGFPVTYFVDVTEYTDRRRELISIYKSQNGAAIAERKISTSKANALRIWGSRGRYAEVFGVFPGTVPPGEGIFDSLPGVYR